MKSLVVRIDGDPTLDAGLIEVPFDNVVSTNDTGRNLRVGRGVEAWWGVTHTCGQITPLDQAAVANTEFSPGRYRAQTCMHCHGSLSDIVQ